MKIIAELNQLAVSQSADLFGVADLRPVRHILAKENGGLVSSFPYSISIGIYLMHDIVDQLCTPADPAVMMLYNRHAYDIVNQRLDLIASWFASLLQADGFKALPVPASLTIDQQRFYGVFSHKMGAYLAGLGWIGKNCLLITPQAGPRVRWATVLTDAPLETNAQPMENRCGSCMECTRICPAGAIYGRTFDIEEPREMRLDVQKCDAYRTSESDRLGVTVNCGMCLYVCPHGRRRKKSH